MTANAWNRKISSPFSLIAVLISLASFLFADDLRGGRVLVGFVVGRLDGDRRRRSR